MSEAGNVLQEDPLNIIIPGNKLKEDESGIQEAGNKLQEDKSNLKKLGEGMISVEIFSIADLGFRSATSPPAPFKAHP